VTRVDPHPHPSPSDAAEQVVCRLDDIGDGASKEVTLPGDPTTICVVRQGRAVHAYVNSCPHTGAPLNWDGDRFLTRDGDMIQCAVHGALFRIHDGLCVWGPCLKQRLTPVPIVIRDDAILMPGEKSSRWAQSRAATK
jgi:nitrite reductase/ring-hydroxylating ferredoxin subunit